MINFRTLLDWISGRIRVEEPESPTTDRERRRFHRITTGDGSAYFDESGPFPVSNLSFGGARIALGKDPVATRMKRGTLVEARFQLGTLQFVTNLKVCGVNSDGELGGEFEGLSAAHGRILGDYLKPRIIGSSFREINASALQVKNGKLRLRWFQGEEGTQIFLWQTLDGDVVKEEYYFLDYVITWNGSNQGIRTGRLPEKAQHIGFGRIDPQRIAFFHVPSYRALRMGKVILEFSNLPAEAKDNLLASISREERRMYHRYCLKANDSQVRFRPRFNPEVVFPVANLSFNGIALLFPEGCLPENWANRKDVPGDLQIGVGRYPARFHVVFGNRYLIGGALHLDQDSGNDALAKFLAPRLLGQSLGQAPGPVDPLGGAPPGSRPVLHVGLHNTHILSLVAPGGVLVTGRIVFMDRVLCFENQKLSEYQCLRGIVFPNDWNIPSDLVDPMPEVDDDLIDLTRQLLAAGNLPQEVREGWERVLPTTRPKPPSCFLASPYPR